MSNFNLVKDAFNKLHLNGGYKSNVKLLKIIADNLPKTVYVANCFILREIKDLTEKDVKNTHIIDINDNINSVAIISKGDTRVMLKAEKYAYVSHKNRLKKAWNETGKIGVKRYIIWVDENNKAVNSVSMNSKVLKIVDEKIKASINEFM